MLYVCCLLKSFMGVRKIDDCCGKSPVVIRKVVYLTPINDDNNDDHDDNDNND